jgi:hypothetical protein
MLRLPQFAPPPCAGARCPPDVAHAARPSILGRRTTLGELLEQSGKLDQVLARLARRVAREAAEAIGDVGGIADLAHLAVADDVNAHLDLAPDDVLNRGSDGRLRGGLVRERTFLAREQHVGHRLRAWQAADVGREDALAAAFQAALPLPLPLAGEGWGEGLISDTCCSTCDRLRASASTRCGLYPDFRG